MRFSPDQERNIEQINAEARKLQILSELAEIDKLTNDDQEKIDIDLRHVENEIQILRDQIALLEGGDSEEVSAKDRDNLPINQEKIDRLRADKEKKVKEARILEAQLKRFEQDYKDDLINELVGVNRRINSEE